ncbi:hypothetical protein ACJZ2D_003342 [Fusarium nematophilum]
MDHSNRPLTRRPRASIACNACRQTKSKVSEGCNGARPICERCERLSLECTYSQNVRDKRLNRQAERRREQQDAYLSGYSRANFQLRSRVDELEAQLAAVSANTDLAEHIDAPEDIPVNISDHDSPAGLDSRYDAETRAEIDTSVPSDKSESRIDVLAAGVFDHPSSGSSLCYFGSSSNHALFWSLTASIANLGHRSTRLHQEPLRFIQSGTGSAQLPQPPSSSIGNYGSRENLDTTASPSREDAVKWISRFFDTVGAVLPYVNEPALLEGFDKIERDSAVAEQSSHRAMQALLTVVFAHALSTQDAAAAEPFYRRTLGLLDPRTLYAPRLELLQALLLLSIFQQNSQRSTESWTTHSLAVKAAYQLGIHAPLSYEHLTASEKELRSGLWFAIINQDRMLSSALGQPCLIPLQHVRTGILDMLVSVRQQRTVEMQYSKENLTYFRNIITLHEVMGAATDSVCGSNIDPPGRLTVEDLLGKTLNLSLRLEQWRISSVGSILTSDVDLDSWTTDDFQSQRNSTLLSVFYYRTMLLVHGPLLMAVLEAATRNAQESLPRVLKNTVTCLLDDDLTAVAGFCQLIRGILTRNPTFLKCNAIWWTCNYAALTLSLHTFAFWLASNRPEAAFIACGHGSSQLEARLRSCLDMLRAIGASSAMSVKAHRCLQRHLEFLKNSTSISASDASRGGQPGASDNGPHLQGHHSLSSAGFPSVSTAGFLDDPIASLFSDLNVPSFGNTDLFDLDLCVTDFDATGLI